jgi:predicted transcriptional regulator
MSEKEAFSVRIPAETRERLDALAHSMDRPRSYLVKEAIDQYLAYHAWKLDRVRAGIEAADRGEFHSHDALFMELRTRYTAKKSPKKPR